MILCLPSISISLSVIHCTCSILHLRSLDPSKTFAYELVMILLAESPIAWVHAWNPYNFNVFKIYVIFSFKICDPLSFLKPDIFKNEGLKLSKINLISLNV